MWIYLTHAAAFTLGYITCAVLSGSTSDDDSTELVTCEHDEDDEDVLTMIDEELERLLDRVRKRAECERAAQAERHIRALRQVIGRIS